MADIVPIRRALISVSDKTGIVAFATALAEHRVEIFSTGGTADMLASGGVVVRDVSDYTGLPQIFGDRVKTLHHKVHGGLLYVRDDPVHVADAQRHGILPIDLLVSNLYPFQKTVLKEGVTLDEAIKNIDIGGPAMIRGAAKNYRFVAVSTSWQHNSVILDELERHGGTSLALREELAAAAYAHTAEYDEHIAAYLVRMFGAFVLPRTIR